MNQRVENSRRVSDGNGGSRGGCVFVNILVTEEEVMEELSSVLQEEEEESLRLEQRFGSHVGSGWCVRKESMARREREEITRQLGNSPRARRRQEIMDMNMEESAMLPVDKV
jgi:hypothetical protein